MAQLYTKDTQAIFWNNNTSAIQRMLDYDYTIQRKKPSVAGIVAPTSGNKFEKFFYGPDEIMIPLYKSTTEAKAAQPQADVLLNFASFRTAYDVTMEALELGGFKSIMITAEGIPERLARKMNATAAQKNVIVIGPATVGAISPGAFKIANIGGTIENIVQSKLHRAGSCGLVTRSGGLFNELSNIIAINADGIAEGVAIGDYYVQTRIRVMQESKRGVDMVINTTLKTASGTGQPNKRYFNTAGYYFDFELGKSFELGAASKTKMRLSTDLGFMSWDVSANTQDDALMYGAKISFMGPRWESITTLAGYWGWMHTHEKYGADFGDVPLVISTKLIYTKNDYSIFAQYQYGIQNFQYHQIRIGTKFSFQKLTPDFSKLSKSN